ncbi:MAG: hypothetical protein WBA12_01150 [Catalinimonas sp.]
MGRCEQIGAWLLLVSLWFSGATLAQSSDSLAPPPAAAPDSLLWARGHNTRQGPTTFYFENQVGGQQFLGARHRLRYGVGQRWMYNQILPDNPFVVQDLHVNLEHTYQLRDRLFWAQEFRVDDYAANRTRLVTLRTGPRGIWERGSFERLTYFGWVGGTSDRRRVATDEGFSWGAAVDYVRTDTTRGLSIYARSTWEAAHIEPRLTRWGAVQGGVEKQFNVFALLRVEGGFRRRQVEDYLGGSIQSIRSDTAFAAMNLSYALTKRLHFRSANQWQFPNRVFLYRDAPGGAPNGRPAQDVRYRQGEMHLNQQLRWQGTKLTASGTFDFRQRVRAYGLENNLDLGEEALQRELERERIKDIREETTSWTYELRYRPGRGHLLFGQTVAQLLRVDTPSDANTQDRDELLYAAEGGWTKRWNRAFRTTMRVSGGYKHFVFVTAAQSIENYRERTVRYEPAFLWHTGRLSWNGQYRLLAIYQVRDATREQAKNRANRVLIMNHELNYELDRRHTAVLEFVRRETRLGRLDWRTFRETPLDTALVYDVTLAGRRRFQRGESAITTQVGYRTFHQSRRQRAGLSSEASGSGLIFLNHLTVQHGPVARVSWERGARLQLAADGWFQWLRIFYRYDTAEGTFLGRTYTDEELARVERDFVPYFNLHFSWLLHGGTRRGRAPAG